MFPEWKMDGELLNIYQHSVRFVHSKESRFRFSLEEVHGKSAADSRVV